MVGEQTRRVDPRALLAFATLKTSSAVSTAPVASQKSSFLRLFAISAASIIGLSAFGAIVVRANDDNGALAFIRQQPVAQGQGRTSIFARRAPPQTAPIYYAPQTFFPRTVTPTQRRDTIVASYAPFGGYFPTEITEPRQPRRKAAQPRSSSVKLSLAAPERFRGFSGTGNVTYCVRTCDGFYFPLSTATGSDRTDEAACNQLCPKAETKLFVSQGTTDIDDAIGRTNGKTYASLANAFSYRKAIDKSCSCSDNGYGLVTSLPLSRDSSLRVGDIIMTKTGMKIFSGGNLPYRDASFTAISGNGLVDRKTREHLRQLENASLPGRSGVEAKSIAKRSRSDELKDLNAATALAQRSAPRDKTAAVRYVGPNRAQPTP
jgi:hypothetical protein